MLEQDSILLPSYRQPRSLPSCHHGLLEDDLHLCRYVYDSRRVMTVASNKLIPFVLLRVDCYLVWRHVDMAASILVMSQDWRESRPLEFRPFSPSSLSQPCHGHTLSKVAILLSLKDLDTFVDDKTYFTYYYSVQQILCFYMRSNVIYSGEPHLEKCGLDASRRHVTSRNSNPRSNLQNCVLNVFLCVFILLTVPALFTPYPQLHGYVRDLLNVT